LKVAQTYWKQLLLILLLTFYLAWILALLLFMWKINRVILLWRSIIPCFYFIPWNRIDKTTTLKSWYSISNIFQRSFWFRIISLRFFVWNNLGIERKLFLDFQLEIRWSFCPSIRRFTRRFWIVFHWLCFVSTAIPTSLSC